MSDEFSRARLESTIRKNYMIKSLKNRTAKELVNNYSSSENHATPKMKKIACTFLRLQNSDLSLFFTQSELDRITEVEIKEIYVNIKENSSKNFKYFYESYLRKIKKGYNEEYVENALEDLKNAYQTYRKVNNSFWNLENSQITISEMQNLYNLMVPQNNNVNPKLLEEK